jgi:uncharacterized protein (TIGR02145 family)
MVPFIWGQDTVTDIDGNVYETIQRGNRGADEGSKLAGRADLWNNGSLVNNEEFGTSGFTGLPGGNIDIVNGNYLSMGDLGKFWSSTEYEINFFGAWHRELYYWSPDISREPHLKPSVISIRCLKD